MQRKRYHEPALIIHDSMVNSFKCLLHNFPFFDTAKTIIKTSFRRHLAVKWISKRNISEQKIF